MADPKAPEMDHAWFCPECGLRDETDRGIDTDGTCSSCGSGCCTWNSLNGHLSQMGWHIVSEADRAATSPLRTRASVDAEIVAEARAAFRGGHPHVPILFAAMNRLCSEPTTDDHGSSSTPAAKESRDNAGVSAGPTNGKCDCGAATFQPHEVNCAVLNRPEPLEDPEPCSCDQAVELQRIIRYVHTLATELLQLTETTPG